jgi:hypothetical protein
MTAKPLQPVHFTCVCCGHGITKQGKYCAGDRNPHCESPSCPWCRECVAAKDAGHPVDVAPHEHVWQPTGVIVLGRRQYQCAVCESPGLGLG